MISRVTEKIILIEIECDILQYSMFVIAFIYPEITKWKK